MVARMYPLCAGLLSQYHGLGKWLDSSVRGKGHQGMSRTVSMARLREAQPNLLNIANSVRLVPEILLLLITGTGSYLLEARFIRSSLSFRGLIKSSNVIDLVKYLTMSKELIR